MEMNCCCLWYCLARRKSEDLNAFHSCTAHQCMVPHNQHTFLILLVSGLIQKSAPFYAIHWHSIHRRQLDCSLASLVRKLVRGIAACATPGTLACNAFQGTWIWQQKSIVDQAGLLATEQVTLQLVRLQFLAHSKHWQGVIVDSSE